jgi:hypothetical protein
VAFASKLQPFEADFEGYVLKTFGRTNNDGYHARDMLGYLHFLKDARRIAKFSWKSAKINDAIHGVDLQTLLKSDRYKPGDMLVLFGRAPASDMAKELVKTVQGVLDIPVPKQVKAEIPEQKRKKKRRGKQKQQQQHRRWDPASAHGIHEQINAMNNKSNVASFAKRVDACPMHAVSVRFEPWDDLGDATEPRACVRGVALKRAVVPYLYDSAKKTRKVLTVETLCRSIVSIDNLYNFAVDIM